MRTGDTPSNDRQKLIRRPPDLLITTPESLYLMLTSTAAETLVGVETVIIDEIHAMATTKRGAHLALTLERLEEVTETAAAADRAVGDPASARGDRRVPRRVPAEPTGSREPGPDRRRRHPQGHGDRGRHPDRGHVRPRAPGRANPRAAVAGSGHGGVATSIWPSIYPEILEADPGQPVDDHLLQRPPRRRAARGQAERARRGGGRAGHRRPRDRG